MVRNCILFCPTWTCLTCYDSWCSSFCWDFWWSIYWSARPDACPNITIKLAKTGDPGRNSPDFLTRQSFSRTIALDGAPEETFAAARDLFQKHFGRGSRKRATLGKVDIRPKGWHFPGLGPMWSTPACFFSWPVGWWAVSGGIRPGSNSMKGKRRTLLLGQKPPGPIELPFSVKLDKFIIKFYKNGQPSEYRSQVTLSEDGREVKKSDILVKPSPDISRHHHLSESLRASLGAKDIGRGSPGNRTAEPLTCPCPCANRWNYRTVKPSSPGLNFPRI